MKDTQKTIPKNAYVGRGDVHNETLNIGRHSIFNIMIAGKADKERKFDIVRLIHILLSKFSLSYLHVSFFVLPYNEEI